MREGGEREGSHALKLETQRKPTAADVREEYEEDAMNGRELKPPGTKKRGYWKRNRKAQHETWIREERTNLKIEKAGKVCICGKIILKLEK